jgi:hydroxypyruvate isomerase
VSSVRRRDAIRRAGLGLIAAAVAPGFSHAAEPPAEGRVVKIGRLRQSASLWPWSSLPLPVFCKAVATMGLTAIDLVDEEKWPVLSDYGLVCSMGHGAGGTIENGLNDPKNHAAIVDGLTAQIPRAARAKVPNVITFFGGRRERPDAEAIRNCVSALERVKPAAEEHGVTVCVELLNSKVDHKDYQGDHTWFGVEVVKAVASPRVKLLYDVYHMQIMEGDVIRTIRDNHAWIGHYHTAGVPGRHELDQTQELNWRAIAQAIAQTGFTGYVAHEFAPTRDPLTSLREAVALCDV